ncbi:MAG: MFS transporter [Sporolactobacillus sp.]|jgi:MFS family permease|nr:MFS transporter [Sporolactobacillus sp.]
MQVLGDSFSNILIPIVTSITKSRETLRYRVNALMTTIASISYFLGPFLVGIFSFLGYEKLFYFYGIIVSLSSLFLLLLDRDMVQVNNVEAKKEDTKKSKRIFSLINTLRYVTKLLINKPLLLSLILIFSLSMVIGVSFDAYEVVFLTKEIGLSNQQYAFSLSLLAIFFLGTSGLNVIIKQKNLYWTFTFGLISYYLYALIFVFSFGYWTILLSYFFLAIGQTLISLSLTSLIQRDIPLYDQNKVDASQNAIVGALQSLVIVTISFLFNFTHSIRYLYLGLFIIYSVLLFILTWKLRSRKDLKIT